MPLALKLHRCSKAADLEVFALTKSAPHFYLSQLERIFQHQVLMSTYSFAIQRMQLLDFMDQILHTAQKLQYLLLTSIKDTPLLSIAITQITLIHYSH